MKKVIFFSILIVLVITLQAVMAKEAVTSREIEIIPDKVNIFTSPVDGDRMTEKPVTSVSGTEVTSAGIDPFASVSGIEGTSPCKDPFQSPLDDKKLPETFNTNTTEPHRENSFINPMPDDKPPVIDNTASRNEHEEISKVEKLFKYTGVLWNGSQYLGIITSDKKSYIVRAGDQLIEGYRVLYLNEKEITVEKKGQKSSLKLQ